MCMKLKNPDLTCELETRMNAVEKRVGGVETRVTSVESELSSLRKESQLGFKEVTSAVAKLGEGFNNRMNNLDKRMVEDKEKWGDCLRKSLTITVKVVLSIVAFAAGVNIVSKLFQ